MRLWILILGSVLIPLEASAGVLSVNSPDIKKGEWSAEAGIAWERDDDKAKDYFREHALELEYSPTDYWSTGLEFVAEREAGEGLRYAVTGWENTFQFLKQKDGAPLSLGLRFEYEKAHLNGEADEVSARLLLRHRTEQWETRLNIGGDKEIGADRESGIEGDLRASVRYHWNDYLTPAIDYLGDTGTLHRLQGFSKQDHRLGPVLYGDLTESIGFEAGYLAGISANAPDHTFKLSLEYVF